VLGTHSAVVVVVLSTESVVRVLVCGFSRGGRRVVIEAEAWLRLWGQAGVVKTTRSSADAGVLMVLMLPFGVDPMVKNERTIRGRLRWTEDLKTINK
jgi:hypothetical protein